MPDLDLKELRRLQKEAVTFPATGANLGEMILWSRKREDRNKIAGNAVRCFFDECNEQCRPTTRNPCAACIALANLEANP